MGKVIQFPKMIQEEVDEVIVPDINNNKSTEVKEEKIGVDVAKYVKIKPIEKEIKTKKAKRKKANSKLIGLLKAINKLKLKNKIVLILVAVAIASLSVAKAESLEHLDSEYSYIESFNMGVAKDLSGEVGSEIIESNNLDDVNITINPTIEGEEFAVYKTEVLISLKGDDIKVKNGEKTFKFKDINIEVLDVSPDLTEEDMLILSDDAISTIAKEAASLTKKVEKELKNKQKDYLIELIGSKM